MTEFLSSTKRSRKVGWPGPPRFRRLELACRYAFFMQSYRNVGCGSLCWYRLVAVGLHRHAWLLIRGRRLLPDRISGCRRHIIYNYYESATQKILVNDKTHKIDEWPYYFALITWRQQSTDSPIPTKLLCCRMSRDFYTLLRSGW